MKTAHLRCSVTKTSPIPTCDANGIVIDVKAVSIEGGDVLNRAGGALVTKPHVVGYQAAGVVREVGANVTAFKVGDHAVTVGAFGSHARDAAVHEATAWKVPNDTDIVLAACVPIPFGTADDCLFEFGHLQKGEIGVDSGRRRRRRTGGDSTREARRRARVRDRVVRCEARSAARLRHGRRHQLRARRSGRRGDARHGQPRRESGGRSGRRTTCSRKA